MKRRTAIKVGLATSAAGVLKMAGCDSPGSMPSGYTRTGLKPGLQAPNIAGPDLDGQPMSLSEFRGNVVLLEFWSPT
jgi:hypothetical protein